MSGQQERYNQEVVQNARRIVAAAGLEKLPLVMALRQIAVALEAVGPARALQVLDDMTAKQ